MASRLVPHTNLTTETSFATEVWAYRDSGDATKTAEADMEIVE
jgi:hypothetical protein